MLLALAEARQAAQLGEIPVGSVLVDAQGKILSSSGNRCITYNDPSAHAEVLTIRLAAAKLGNYRLPRTVLVTTLEPCIMCLGCLVQARTAGIVFALRDPKAGAVVSRLKADEDLHWLNSKFWFAEGLLQEQSKQLLQDFFREKRQKNGEVPKSGRNGPDSKSGWR